MTLWVYWPGLNGPFLFDDFANLSALGEYGNITDGQGLIRYLRQGIAGPTGRPISLLSFLLNDTNWPSQPWSFKYTNLLIHLLNGTLAYWCGLKILSLNSLPQLRQPAAWLALASCGLWMLHPLLVSTTLYVVQRMTQLSALFSLMGILLYLHGRKTLQTRPRVGYAWMTVAVGPCTLLAVYSKENGALLPLLLGVVEFTVLRHQSLLARHPSRWWTLAFVGGPALATVAYLGRFLTPDHAGAFASRAYTVFERGLTEARILVTYLYHLVIPKLYSGSLFNDDYPISTGLLDPPTTAPALLAIGVLLAIAYRTRQSHPLLSLALLFFFVGHLLESTVAPLDLYYEHRNYLPSVFLFLPLAYAVERHGRLLFYGVLSLLLIVGGFTSAKAKLWSNEAELLLFWAKQHPDSVRAQRYASNIYLSLGAYGKAIAALQGAMQKHPEDFRLRLHRMTFDCFARQPDPENKTAMLQLAQTKPVFFESQAFDMMVQLVDLAGQAQCPGLTLADLLGLTDALLVNPAVKDSVSYRYLLTHIKGAIALQQKDGKAALGYFSVALSLSGDPETGLLESALLATHGFYPEALLHLQASERLLATSGLPPSGILAKHDYPVEIERLRKNIQEDMAHKPTPHNP